MDEVIATDPRTGTTAAKPVTTLHRNADTDLADVTIQDSDTGQSTTLHTTANHPFWAADTQTWTDAQNLKPGTPLANPHGTATQIVTAIRTWTGLHWMRDLTVADTHTYYVVAGTTPVLVHNCDPVASNGASLENISASDAARIQATADRIGQGPYILLEVEPPERPIPCPTGIT